MLPGMLEPVVCDASMLEGVGIVACEGRHRVQAGVLEGWVVGFLEDVVKQIMKYLNQTR